MYLIRNNEFFLIAEEQKRPQNCLGSPPHGNNELSLNFAAPISPLRNNIGRQICRSVPQLSNCQPEMHRATERLRRWMTDLRVCNRNCFASSHFLPLWHDQRATACNTIVVSDALLSHVYLKKTHYKLLGFLVRSECLARKTSGQRCSEWKARGEPTGRRRPTCMTSDRNLSITFQFIQ